MAISVTATIAQTADAAMTVHEPMLCEPPGDRRRYRNRMEHLEANKAQM